MTTRASRATSARRGGTWSRNRLRQVEEANVLALAKILGAKKLRQTDDVRSESCSLSNMADRRLKVCVRVRPHPHLHKANVVFALVFHVGSEFFRIAFFWRCSKANPAQRDWPQKLRFTRYSSRIRTAAAIVVVQSPRLSPTADWVTLLVRTILLEMR